MEIKQLKKSSTNSAERCKHRIKGPSYKWTPARKFGLTHGFIGECSKCGKPVWIIAQKEWPEEDYAYSEDDYTVKHIEDLPHNIAAKYLLEKVR